MFNFLLTPGAPFFAISLAGVALAAIGLLRVERLRLLATGVRAVPAGRGVAVRLAVGQAAAIPLSGAVLLASLAGGLSGAARGLALATAAGIYLYLGLVVPRRPLVAAERERKELRRLTPGFVSYVRIGLAGFEAPASLLTRYVARVRPSALAMQRVVAEALAVMQERRMRPFEALRAVALAGGCRELTDIAEALAQAEAEGTDAQAALEAYEATLEALLRDEFTRMLKRRTVWLLLVVAVSLVVGILGNLLYVMVAGSPLFQGGL
ncbi:MAG: hypothetical protein RLZZ387_1615 [Chloroflexota bacterium]|jgi:hypothetical protein